MNRVILHIGLHKTASTYLQKYYFPQLKVKYLRHFKDVSYLGSKDCGFLLSSEGFSGLAWNADWLKGKANDYHWIKGFKNSINNLHELFPSAEIVVFIRKPGDLLISMYKQYLHEGGVLKFKEFYGSEGVIRLEDLALEKRISLLKALFPKVNIISYEYFKEGGDDFLDSFFSSIGIIKKEKRFGPLKANTSVSGKKMELLRSSNVIWLKMPKIFKSVLSKFKITPRNIFQKKLRFWRSSDPMWMKEVREEVNTYFVDEWCKVEKQTWQRIAHQKEK